MELILTAPGTAKAGRTPDVTEPIVDDPCVVFALRRESLALWRQLRPYQRFKGAPCAAWRCGPAVRRVLILETGPGPQRTEAAMRWLLAQPLVDGGPYRPRFVVSAGFSGALQEAQGIGDVIVASEVLDAGGNHWPAAWPAPLSARCGRSAFHVGRVLAVDHLVAGPAEKRSLGLKHQAVAVDMETTVIARCCTAHRIPFGCVRAISDRLDTPLSPKLLACLKGGRVSLWRLLVALAACPALGLELRRLARDTRQAAENLTQVLSELLLE